MNKRNIFFKKNSKKTKNLKIHKQKRPDSIKIQLFNFHLQITHPVSKYSRPEKAKKPVLFVTILILCRL